MRRLKLWKIGFFVTLLGGLAAGTLAGCGDGRDPIGGPYDPNDPQPGQTEFESDELGNGRYSGRGNYAAGAPTDKDSMNDGNAPPEAAPQGRNAAVEEADIYRIDKNRLFYLNTYRGFLIYDVNDAKKPKRLGRLPVYGYPIEMFVSGNTVYALLSDVLYLKQAGEQLVFERKHVSQLIAIDITNVNAPKVIKTVDIVGALREGVSRKIENTIYVVSQVYPSYYGGWAYNGDFTVPEKEQAWVYSFNVADAKNPQLVDQLQLFEGGQTNVYDPKTGNSAYRSFSGVALSATSNALMVVENWYQSAYQSGNSGGSDPKPEPANCGSYSSSEQAVVSVVDISDPQGKIRLHTKFETSGHLQDQFKQTYLFDEKTQKGTYLGIFARQEWFSQDCQGGSFIQNTMQSWDITNGKSPTKQSELAFGKENETVRGSTFDPARGVAYAITARNIDPLYVISFADPKNLKVLSAIDGLSGDMTVFRLVADNKFLMGIGRDNSDACTGFDDNSTDGWRATKIAVSLIDVQNLNGIRLVQRQCVAVKNAEWVGSSINWNLDQAHKMIGMHSDGIANVITVPVYYYAKSSSNDDWWWYNYKTAVGLMTWDLSKYDPSKSEKDQNVLQNFGTIIHPEGEVKRSIVFTHQGAEQRRMAINLSDTHISMVDINDLKNPVQQSVVEIAPYLNQIYTFGDYVVEQVQNGATGYWGAAYGKSEFRVKKAGGDLEQTAPAAIFSVGGVQRVMKQGNNLVLFRQPQADVGGKTSPYNGNENSIKTEVLVYDLSTPTVPKKRGSVEMSGNFMPYYRFWCGMDFWNSYWFGYGDQNNWMTTAEGIAFVKQTYDYNAYNGTNYKMSRSLVYLNLANVDNPVVSESDFLNDDAIEFLGLLPDPDDKRGFVVSYRKQISQTTINNQTFTKFKYFARSFGLDGKGSFAAASNPINVPGRVIKTFKADGERRYMTHDYSYKVVTIQPQANSGVTKPYEQWLAQFRLHLLKQIGTGETTVASLTDSRKFSDMTLSDLVLDGDHLFLNARPEAAYYGYGDTVVSSGNGSSAEPAPAAESSDSKSDAATTPTAWEKYSDRLMIFDIGNAKFDERYNAPTGTSWMQLMGAHQNRLFVNLQGEGILVIDASNLSKPKGQQFMRTLGYASQIEFIGNQVFVPSGYFGTYQLTL